MDQKTLELRMAYDALIKVRRDIRQEVKDKYREEFNEKVKSEVAERTRNLDYEFAMKLVAAKDSGLKRSDISEAIRTNAHNRLKYFLDLAGSGGFQQGRPKVSSSDKLKLSAGWEIIDSVKGLVRIFRMRKHVFDEPIVGILRYNGGLVYQLESFEGSDVSEWEAAKKALQSASQEEYKKEVFAVYHVMRDELERSGWVKNWKPGHEEVEEQYIDPKFAKMFGG